MFQADECNATTTRKQNWGLGILKKNRNPQKRQPTVKNAIAPPPGNGPRLPTASPRTSRTLYTKNTLVHSTGFSITATVPSPSAGTASKAAAWRRGRQTPWSYGTTALFSKPLGSNHILIQSTRTGRHTDCLQVIPGGLNPTLHLLLHGEHIHLLGHLHIQCMCMCVCVCVQGGGGIFQGTSSTGINSPGGKFRHLQES